MQLKNDDSGIILFDGVCNLCNRFVKFIIVKDRLNKFHFSPLQKESTKELLRKFNIDFSKLDTVIYIKDEEVFAKSSAALHVLKDIGGIWKLFFVFIIVPKFIRDFIYSIVVRNRYRIFGKSDSCMIPSEKDKARFL